MNDLMAEMTRFFLAFMAGMLTGPLFYCIVLLGSDELCWVGWSMVNFNG